MKSTILFAIAMLFAVSAAADKTETAEKPAPTPIEKTKAEEKKVADVEKVKKDLGYRCKRRSVVGTHRKVKVCTTSAQREEIARESKDKLRDSYNSQTGRGPID